MGEAPDRIVLVESVEDVDRLEVEDPTKVAYISQTTLSVDETRAIINRLRERFPAIVGPRTDDICYATTNRQAAVKQLARECDLVLVIGSRNSSNSNRLVEVAREHGADSHLIDNELAGRARSGWRASAWSGSPRARAPRRSSSSAWSSSSGPAGTSDVAGARGGPGGRPLHAPQGDPPGDGDRAQDGRPPPAHARRLGPAPRRATEADVLRRGPSRARRCWRALAGFDRLVLLGDTLELRHGPLRDALAAAEPVLRELAGGARRGRRGRDRARATTTTRCCAAGSSGGRRARPAPLGLGVRGRLATSGSRWRRWRAALAPARVRVDAIPGVWLRDDVYATHGHYGDRHNTVPILERLGAGLMVRVGRRARRRSGARRGLRGGARADVRLDRRGRAERRPARPRRRRASRSRPGARSRRRGRPRGASAAAAWRSAFPAAVAALNRAGLGPLRADVSGVELRRGALRGVRGGARAAAACRRRT